MGPTVEHVTGTQLDEVLRRMAPQSSSQRFSA